MAKQEIGKAEINVKNGGGAIIGSLGVIAHPQRAVNVYLWSVIENPSGNKTQAQLDSASNSLMYSANEQIKLKEKLDQVYHQVGIDIILHVAGTITYDPNSVEYNSFVKNKKADSRQKGNNLYEKLRDDNRNTFDNNDGPNLMIIDAKCEYTDVADGRSITGNLGGLGGIGTKYAIVFNQARTNYGTCTHEIGHNFGYMHSFYDSDDLKDFIPDKNTNIARLQNNLINNQNQDDIDYINLRISQEQTLEKLLFKEKTTTNIMDYNNNMDFLFKWQWDIVNIKYKIKKSYF